MKRLLAFLLILAPVAYAQDPYDRDIPIDEYFPKASLVVEASALGCHRFEVYVASTNAQRRRGLMFVRYLAPFDGMLFVYERDALLSIWMRNTLIPLDIVYVRRDGQVASIFRDAVPMSETSMRADEPVRYVLELNGGISEALYIDEDSRLLLDLVEYVDN